MGTVIVSIILFLVVTLIVKSLYKKHLMAKKSGGCCGCCAGCTGGCGKDKQNIFIGKGLLNKFDLRLLNFQFLTLESNLFFVKPQFRVNRLNVSEVIVFVQTGKFPVVFADGDQIKGLKNPSILSAS